MFLIDSILTMRVSLTTFIAVMVLAGSGAAGATTVPSWPESPSRLQLDTPYGELQVSSSEYVYESHLMLDLHKIQPVIKGLLNIPYAFSSPEFHVALISINIGDNDCPVKYKWIKLQKNGYAATPRFGSCSESIKVETQGTAFIVTTPNEQDPKELDTYVYDGNIVKKKSEN